MAITVLGIELKRHYQWMMDRLKSEISYQIQDVWGGYFGHLIAAQAGAMQRQRDALDDADKADEDGQRILDRALSALSIASGLTMAWFTAALQYRLYARYFSKWEVIQDWADVFGKIFIYRTVESHDKVAARMFGLYGQALVGSLADNVGQNVTVKPYSPPDSNTAAMSPTICYKGVRLTFCTLLGKVQNVSLIVPRSLEEEETPHEVS